MATSKSSVAHTSPVTVANELDVSGALLNLRGVAMVLNQFATAPPDDEDMICAMAMLADNVTHAADVVEQAANARREES